MSRRTTTPAARRASSSQFGKRLKQARGDLSLAAAAAAMGTLLPDSAYRLNPETIRRWENGDVTEALVDPVAIMLLCRVYEVEVRRISPMHANTVERIAALANTTDPLVTAQ